ncbi:MAG: hypothetical protein BAJALOKI2v1_40073 [Promethearchaeota archaeon]|nr:MAG: hypothetical protein BAJALOKI2v1_40073 [Candidatus Lokiarchaeota archaeon]
MKRSWFKLRNPDIFQGDLKNDLYFEGWYFKLVDDSKQNSIAIIPTIAINQLQKNSHVAIQVLDALQLKYNYIRYPLTEFRASDKEFKVKIHRNYFSKSRLSLDIKRPELDLKANLKFDNLVPIPRSLISPGIMGFLLYFPFLQTYHGIVSMCHSIRGTMSINDRTIDFKKKAKGYIEKDWGQSFPAAWIWMQTNHFDQENVSFMCSVAKVPLFNKHFTGFLCMLWVHGKFYRFASYNLSRIRYLKGFKKKAFIVLENMNYHLTIKASLGKTVDMKAPQAGSMVGHCFESMESKIEISLFQKDVKGTNKNDVKILFKGTGIKAGLELMNVKLLEV